MTSMRAGAMTSKRTRPQWQPPVCVIDGFVVMFSWSNRFSAELRVHSTGA